MQSESLDDLEARNTAWASDAVGFMRGIDKAKLANDQLGAFALQHSSYEELLDLREADLLVTMALTGMVMYWTKTLLELPRQSSVRCDISARRILFTGPDGFVLRIAGESLLIDIVTRRTHLIHVQSVLLVRGLMLALASQPPVEWGALIFETKETGFKAFLKESR